MGFDLFRAFVEYYAAIGPPKKTFGELVASTLKNKEPGSSLKRFTKTDRTGAGLMFVRLRTTGGWHAGLATEITLRPDALQIALYNQQGQERLDIKLEDLTEFYEWQLTNGSHFIITDGKLVKETPKTEFSGGKNANLISAKTEPFSVMVQ